MISSPYKTGFKRYARHFTALCGRWWRVKVRFAGFLLALPLQNRRKARVEQPQVRARLKFASVCKFELAQRLVVKGFCPCEPLRKAIACGLPRKAFALLAMTTNFCHFERSALAQSKIHIESVSVVRYLYFV